ncbi:MAG: ABC transporter substrate-binding protein [Christensenella hongkongensis]|uniref:ABC transporter substrate-binding protein n=1 Tax=Christensenella hongkongensis TaxID=270498 RepID=UPI002A74F16B|nr:ABC transporter substrate-binding protein [Christensenella hongkongensis]MDY3005092.1 ABC transporter substrate-binding protein [Christensenella hongkongensis]
MKNIKNYISLGKKFVCILLAGAALLLLGACGGDQATQSGDVTVKSSADASADATQTAQGDLQKQGGDLFIAMPEGITSLDPLAATNEDLINLLTLIYDPAIRIDGSGKPQASVIESWEVDESGSVYTFHIRQNVVFVSGDETIPLTADDVIYSAQKVGELTGTQFPVTDGTTPEPQPTDVPEEGDNGESGDTPSASPSPSSSASASASPSSSESGSADPSASATIDIPQTNRYTQYNSLVSGFEKIDDHTIKLTMTKPGMEALYFMAFPVQCEGQNNVGSGPYKISSFDAETEMELNVNESWWGTKPNITRIVAKATTGNSAKLDAVSTSILDFVTTDVLYSGKYKLANKTQVIDYMTNYYDCIVPNLGNFKLEDTNVRQAISYAIDRREIISTVLLNHAVPANLPISPDFYAYDTKYTQDDDLKTARQLLQEAGYRTDEVQEGSELNLTLIVPNDRDMSYRMEAAKMIRKQLGRVGIVATIEELEAVDYYSRLQNRDFELAFCSFYLDDNPSLGFLFNSDGSANYGGVNNQEITDAINTAENAFTEDAVESAYSELQRILVERVPQIGLYFRMNSAVCNETLTNINGMHQNDVFYHINEWYYEKAY